MGPCSEFRSPLGSSALRGLRDYQGERATLVEVDPNHFRNGFTVLVNPDAAGVLQRRRRNGRG